MRTSVGLKVVGIVLLGLATVAPVAAQAPVADPSPAGAPSILGSPGADGPPVLYTECPVSLEAATAIAGVAMRPSPFYQTADGTLYVEHSARIPGGDMETTIYTCAYLSATGIPPDRNLFLQFSVGDSAAWLWEINGPTIADGTTYQAVADSDPSTVDIYRTTSFFPADGEAFPLPVWEADRYLQSDRLFAHIIVSAAGEQVHAEQVELMASIIGLALEDAGL